MFAGIGDSWWYKIAGLWDSRKYVYGYVKEDRIYLGRRAVLFERLCAKHPIIGGWEVRTYLPCWNHGPKS